ncbi:MAG: hypothetical protein KGL02_06570 [Acidobacteriota bacterium]|nr:hypothetical protein [Acidobacteriota bacterium]
MKCMVRVVRGDGLTTGDIGTAAIAALSAIDGVESPAVEDEDGDGAIISYNWTRGSERFDRTDEHLAQYRLEKDWDWNRDPLA